MKLTCRKDMRFLGYIALGIASGNGFYAVTNQLLRANLPAAAMSLMGSRDLCIFAIHNLCAHSTRGRLFGQMGTRHFQRHLILFRVYR